MLPCVMLTLNDTNLQSLKCLPDIEAYLYIEVILLFFLSPIIIL